MEAKVYDDVKQVKQVKHYVLDYVLEENPIKVEDIYCSLYYNL